MNRIAPYFFGFLFLVVACTKELPVTLSIPATLETAPVASANDAADDAAIFVHPTDPSKHAIIATDKQKGLVVYDLNGQELHRYDVGRMNNVDLRQNYAYNLEQTTLVGASNGTNNTIVFYKLDPETLELVNISGMSVFSAVDEVYGFCLYQHAKTKKTYAFVVGKDGKVEQWELTNGSTGVIAQLVRSWDVGGQCEGMVADDELGYLYVGEEDKGIWRFNADPEKRKGKTKVDRIKRNPYLKEDVEGLTIYYGKDGRGYLIASSQGNNSFAIYERGGKNKYLGSFKIGDTADIDGTKDTDGIDVINVPMGPAFPNGFLIAQDGFNEENGQPINQNFKLVPWENIAKKLTPNLLIDSQYRRW